MMCDLGVVGSDPLFVRVVADFFTLIVQRGSIPKQWKDAVMVPVPKAGKDLELATSWRPVAITVLLCRCFERCLQRRLREATTIAPEQYGFRPGCSTLEPILEKVLMMQDAMMRFSGVQTSFSDGTTSASTNAFRALLLAFDFTDAFCRVTADQVVEQYVKHLKDPGSAARWYAPVLRDFMTNRRMSVRFGGARSEARLVDVGVPQGSVLGPLLFLFVSLAIIAQLKAALAKATFEGNKAEDLTRPEGQRTQRSLIGYAYMPNRVRKASNVEDTTSDSFTSTTFYADDSGTVVAGVRNEWLQVVAQRMATAFAVSASRFGIEVSKKSTLTLFSPTTTTEAQCEASPPGFGEMRVYLPEWDEPLKVTTDPVRDLGVHLDQTLSMSVQQVKATNSMAYRVFALRSVRHLMSSKTARGIYYGAVLSLALFGSEAWYFALSQERQRQLEVIHNRGLRVITGCQVPTKLETLRALACLPSLRDLVYQQGAASAEKLRGPRTGCTARARFAHDGRLASRVPRKIDTTTTLREACPDPLPSSCARHPLLAHLDEPLFRAEDTAAATNVTFMAHFKHASAVKKGRMPADALLRLNFMREDLLPARHWRLLSDGSKRRVHPDEEKPRAGEQQKRSRLHEATLYSSDSADSSDDDFAATLERRKRRFEGRLETGCASMLQLHDRHAGTFRTIWKEHSKVCSPSAACAFSCEANACCMGVERTNRTLNHFDVDHDKSLPGSVDGLEPLAPLDAAPGEEGLPLVMMLDSLSIVSMLGERGATGQRDYFGARMWQQMLQLAKFRKVFVVFVYSHVGYSLQDMVDIEAEVATRMSLAELDAAHSHPTWWADRARIQREDITARSRKVHADAHVAARANGSGAHGAFFAYHCRTLPQPNQLPRRAWHIDMAITRMQSGVDIALGGVFHREPGLHEVCPMPGCGCAISVNGMIDLCRAENSALLAKQTQQRAVVSAAVPVDKAAEAAAVKVGIALSDLVLEHPISHALRCPSAAACALRVEHLGAGEPRCSKDLFRRDESLLLRLAQYRADFVKLRSRAQRGVPLNGGGEDDAGGSGNVLKAKKPLPKKQQQQQRVHPRPFFGQFAVAAESPKPKPAGKRSRSAPVVAARDEPDVANDEPDGEVNILVAPRRVPSDKDARNRWPTPVVTQESVAAVADQIAALRKVLSIRPSQRKTTEELIARRSRSSAEGGQYKPILRYTLSTAVLRSVAGVSPCILQQLSSAGAVAVANAKASKRSKKAAASDDDDDGSDDEAPAPRAKKASAKSSRAASAASKAKAPAAKAAQGVKVPPKLAKK